MGVHIKDDFERLPYIHRLFNRLQESLNEEVVLMNLRSMDKADGVRAIANRVDELHHDFTDLVT